MGTILFISICVLVTLAAFIWNLYEHKKIMLETTREAHWNDRVYISYKAREIADAYPCLSKITLSFTESDDKYDTPQIIKKVSVLDKSKKSVLDQEVKEIIQNDDKQAKRVLAWYMMTCIILRATENKENVMEISEESKKLNKNQFDKLSSDSFCLV